MLSSEDGAVGIRGCRRPLDGRSVRHSFVEESDEGQSVGRSIELKARRALQKAIQEELGAVRSDR